MLRIRDASCPTTSKDMLTKHIVVYIWLCSCAPSKSNNHVLYSNPLQKSLLVYEMLSSPLPGIVTTPSVCNIRNYIKCCHRKLKNIFLFFQNIFIYFLMSSPNTRSQIFLQTHTYPSMSVGSGFDHNSTIVKHL